MFREEQCFLIIGRVKMKKQLVTLVDREHHVVGSDRMSDVSRANTLEKAHRADRDEEMRKELRSYGISEKNFIVKDEKIFIYSPYVTKIYHPRNKGKRVDPNSCFTHYLGYKYGSTHIRDDKVISSKRVK